MTYAQWVVGIRRSAGLSQTEFAERIGMRDARGRANHVSVSNWETGKYEPTRQNIKAILASFPDAPPPPGLHRESKAVPRSVEARSVASRIDIMDATERRRAMRWFFRKFPEPTVVADQENSDQDQKPDRSGRPDKIVNR